MDAIWGDGVAVRDEGGDVSKFIFRADPEEVKHLDQIWRPLYCLSDMHRFWNRPEYQYEDAGYCLDRYSLTEAKQIL